VFFLLQEEFEETKGVMNILTSKKDIYNKMTKRKNNKKTNNGLQITTQKTKDRATRSSLKTWGAPVG
jgi:hypothetical protein